MKKKADYVLRMKDKWKYAQHEFIQMQVRTELKKK